MSDDEAVSDEIETDDASATPDVEAGSEGEKSAPNGADDAGEAEADATIDEGDFVRLDYTVRTTDGRVIDTTDPEIAEEEGLDEEGREFGPRTVAIGAGHLFDRVESAITEGGVGASGTVTVPAAEAFGEYDEEQVRTISADRIDEENRRPGGQVQVDGEQGIVETVIGGRARVDFNHPLAGDDVEYEYTVLDRVDDRIERAQGLLDATIGMDLDCSIETDEVEEETVVGPDDSEDESEGAESEVVEPETEPEIVERETLYIESTPQLSMNQQWLFQKQQIAQELIDRLDLDRVVIRETIDGGGMPGMMGMGGPGGAPGGGLDDLDADTEEVLEELEADDADIEDVLDDLEADEDPDAETAEE
jgi:FKBP-type peptidyl-prolyl cis-trans isomerase SlyD